MADPHRSRVDRIVDYLREHRSEIDSPEVGTTHIEIDYAGDSIVVKIGHRERIGESGTGTTSMAAVG